MKKLRHRWCAVRERFPEEHRALALGSAAPMLLRWSQKIRPLVEQRSLGQILGLGGPELPRGLRPRRKWRLLPVAELSLFRDRGIVGISLGFCSIAAAALQAARDFEIVMVRVQDVCRALMVPAVEIMQAVAELGRSSPSSARDLADYILGRAGGRERMPPYPTVASVLPRHHRADGVQMSLVGSDGITQPLGTVRSLRDILPRYREQGSGSPRAVHRRGRLQHLEHVVWSDPDLGALYGPQSRPSVPEDLARRAAYGPYTGEAAGVLLTDGLDEADPPNRLDQEAFCERFGLTASAPAGLFEYLWSQLALSPMREQVLRGQVQAGRLAGWFLVEVGATTFYAPGPRVENNIEREMSRRYRAHRGPELEGQAP